MIAQALQYRLRDQVTETKTKSKDVMILIKVTDVFYKPQMSVIIDPWEYLDKGQLKLQGGWKFTASLDCNSVPQIALSENISPVVPGTGDADIFSPLTGNVADNTRRQTSIHGENRETSRSTFHSEFGDLPGIGGMPATGESRSQGIQTTANEVYDTPPIIITGHGNPDTVSSAPSPAHYSSDGRIASLKRVHPRMILHNVRSRFFSAGPSRHSPITSTYIESGSGPDSDQIPAGASDSTNTIAFATVSTGARSSPGPPDQTGREMSHLWFATRLEPVSAAKTYQHERLDGKQMRLLTLFPGEEFEPLNGLIWVTRLDAKPHYMTVSYVWGTKSRLSNALRTPVGSISITEPLYLTLKKLRKRQKSIVLWVDAICINQNDDDEKTEQVRMLAQIFQNSAQTLGVVRGDEQSNKVIEMLMQVRAREVVSDESRAWPRNLPFCPKSWNERGLPPPLDPIWLKTVEFFRNDWFRRVWIIQEVVIARNIKLVCGKYTLDWEDLYSATQKIDQDPEMRVQADEVRQSWQPFLRLGDLRHLEASSNRLSTLVLLETFRHCQSTKRRDRFFSLLGIAADGDLEDFELDYKSPFEKVARRFGNALFRKYSERKQGMLLLYRAGLDEDKPDSPSWMPDWTREKQRSLLASANRGALFRAAWGSEESLKLYPKVGELTTDAYFVDTIKIVTQSCLDPGKRRQCRFFLEVEKIIENTYDRMDEADRAELLWRVPIAGAKYPKVAISGDHSLFNSWEAYWKLLKLDWSGNDKNATSGHVSREGKPSNLAEKSKAYASLLKDEVGGWRFVTTKHHLLCGMAPPNAREGDAVYIFCGGDVPFITRPSKDRPGTQRLVGQGYFHGIMEGEALDSGHIEKEELKLH